MKVQLGSCDCACWVQIPRTESFDTTAHTTAKAMATQCQAQRQAQLQAPQRTQQQTQQHTKQHHSDRHDGRYNSTHYRTAELFSAPTCDHLQIQIREGIVDLIHKVIKGGCNHFRTRELMPHCGKHLLQLGYVNRGTWQAVSENVREFIF